MHLAAREQTFHVSWGYMLRCDDRSSLEFEAFEFNVKQHKMQPLGPGPGAKTP